jgi:hypothetical protein
MISKTQESHVFETDNLCVNVGFVGTEDEGQSVEIVMKAKEDEGLSFQSNEERQHQNFELEEDEEKLSHKDNQDENHTSLIKGNDGKELPKHDVAGEEELAHEDIQKKDKGEEQHSNAMCMEWDEKINLLEELLRKVESKVAREKKCS